MASAGKRARTKGSTNERELAHAFKAWWGWGQWARTPSSGGWATQAHRDAFRTCGDIITTATDFPFCIEAKKQENWFLDQLLHVPSCKVFAWWKQTLDECPADMAPLLVMARNFVPQTAVFDPVLVADRLSKPVDYVYALVEQYTHFNFWMADRGSALVIVPLQDFFKIKPSALGRDDANVEREHASGAGSPSAV